MDLFSAYPLLGLNNRSVMAPMTRCTFSNDGLPDASVENYYVERAKQGVGLIIIEGAAINAKESLGYQNGAQFHQQKHCEAWKKCVDQIHQAGSKVWIQLYHAGRLTTPSIAQGAPLAPSPLAPEEAESFWRPKMNGQIVHQQSKTPFVTPEEISISQIDTIIEQFSSACLLAEQAGFDGVELHAAHGYLIHGFQDASTNKRQDSFGTSIDSFPFSEKLVQACRKTLSSHTELAYRVSLHRVDNPFVRYDKADLNFTLLAKRLSPLGVDFFHCSQLEAGTPLFGSKKGLPALIREGCTTPIILCGAIRSLEQANTLLNTEKIDLIAFGRLLMSNPDLLTLLRDNHEDRLIPFDHTKHLPALV